MSKNPDPRRSALIRSLMYAALAVIIIASDFLTHPTDGEQTRDLIAIWGCLVLSELNRLAAVRRRPEIRINTAQWFEAPSEAREKPSLSTITSQITPEMAREIERALVRLKRNRGGSEFK